MYGVCVTSEGNKVMEKKKRCPYCNNVIVGHSNKRFCNQKHKDKYHNTNNPRGYYKHLNSEELNARDIEDTFHPFDSYSLGQE